MKYCVYFHKNTKDEIVYIGQGSLTRPFKQSRRSKDWIEYFKHNELKVEVFKVYQSRFKTKEDAMRIAVSFKSFLESNDIYC